MVLNNENPGTARQLNKTATAYLSRSFAHALRMLWNRDLTDNCSHSGLRSAVEPAAMNHFFPSVCFKCTSNPGDKDRMSDFWPRLYRFIREQGNIWVLRGVQWRRVGGGS